jgi:hypothetical protein
MGPIGPHGGKHHEVAQESFPDDLDQRTQFDPDELDQSPEFDPADPEPIPEDDFDHSGGA